jgi:hypothetical protein
MLELEDDDVFSGSIGNTNTETVTVDATKAEHFEVLVDDTSSGAPASYDLTVEYYSTAADAFMQADSVSASTDFSPAVDKGARGQRVRISLTNTSGSSSPYRISLESFKEI